MKSALKEIAAVTETIKLRQAEVEKIQGDVGRAQEVIQEAEGFQDQIDKVSRKRAEVKALAFVEGKKADTKEFDKQEAELERVSRQAREDSAAATLAIELLQGKHADIQSEIDRLVEDRRQLAVQWLIDRRESAIDRYIKAMSDIGPFVAEAAAADRVLSRLSAAPKYGLHAGMWLLDALKKADVPFPHSRAVTIPGRAPGLPGVTPFAWKRDYTLGDQEQGQIIAELQTHGVLPASVVDTAVAATAVEEGP